MAARPEGGPTESAAANWRHALWITYGIAGCLYLLSRLGSGPPGAVGVDLLVALAVVGSSAPLVWVVARMGPAMPPRPPMQWPTAYALSVLATGFGACVASLLTTLAGRPAEWSARLLLDVTVVGPIWILLIGSGVVLWQSARLRRRQLQCSLHEIDDLVEAGADVTQALEVVTRRELRRAVSELPAPGDSGSGTMRVEDWTRISEELRMVTRDVVRPLSHSLPRTRTVSSEWQRGPIGWIHRIVSREDFNPLLVAAVFTAGAVSARVQDYGWVAGLGLLAAENALIFAVMVPANALMRRVRFRAPVYVAALMLLQIIPLLPWPSLLGEVAEPGVGARVSSIVASVMLILIASGVTAIRTQSQERIEYLQAVVDEATSRGSREATQIARMSRELASRLHGSVQATLMSTAFAIEVAARDGHWEDARRLFDSLADVLVRVSDPTPVRSRDLAEAIHRVCLPWRAVGAIEVELADSVSGMPDDVVDSVTNVVAEAVTNAFRHGLAHRVDISVSVEDGDVILTVIDDGQGVGKVSRARWGLGLASIDEETQGRWRLTSVSGTTRFQAEVALPR